MSGFEALGAAATIIQFIEYGIKIGNKAVAVYKGKDEPAELWKMATDFQEVNKSFIGNLKLRSSGPDSGEALLIHTAEECQQTATELIDLVNDLRATGEKSKRTAFKLASKSELRKSDVVAKQDALRRWQRQCQEQLSMLISDRQYALADTLSRMERRQTDHDSALSRRLTELKKGLIEVVKGSKTSEDASIVGKLLDAQKLGSVDLPRQNILSSLRFPQMRNREDRIDNPSHATYEWIFDTQTPAHTTLPPVRYIPWLEAGSETFWVTGKAGSGKSTLMKYICNDDRTKTALKHWANGRKLIVASHYFWSSGSPLEKSYSGLLMSILYKALYDCPNLIKSICGDRWREELSGSDTRTVPWTKAELLASLEQLLVSDLPEIRDLCFCFFIDGLDEYDGDYEVVDALVCLSRNDNIKICASSRPWNRFQVAFDSSKRKGNFLELHHYTKGDLERFVEGELRETLTKTNTTGSDWRPLISEIVDRSDGVFLWVTLVVKKELRPMLEARESIASLQARLEVIPSDLNEYFQRIFERMWADTLHRRDTARIFKACLATYIPLPAAAIDVLTDVSPVELAISTPIVDRVVDCAQLEPEKVEVAAARVNSRCQDLLEVVSGTGIESTFEHHRIEFLHRSVKDCLDQSSTISDQFDEYAGCEFDTHAILSACYVFLIKTMGMALYHPHQNESGHEVQEVQMLHNWSNLCLIHMGHASFNSLASQLLRQLDSTMQHMHSERSQSHWSNYDRLFFDARIGGRDLTVHLISLRLLAHVEAAIDNHPLLLEEKKGRPYLHYALRPQCNIDDSAVHEFYPEQVAMVELLLKKGSDVNQVDPLSESRTEWDLWLAYLYDHKIHDPKEVPRKITWLLIEHGARPIKGRLMSKERKQKVGTTARYHKQKYSTTTEYTTILMEDMLAKCFGNDEAKAMCERIAENDVSGGW